MDKDEVGKVVAVGERVRIEGFALAGVLTFTAEEPAGVAAAWQALPDDVAVVVLTPAAAAAVVDRVADTVADTASRSAIRPGPRLTVVLPP